MCATAISSRATPAPGRREAISLLGASALAGLPGSTTAAPAPLAISFAPPASSGPPAGFSVGLTGGGSPPVWSVIPEPSVPGGHVLAQTSMDKSDYRFPLAIYDNLSAANLDVSVRFKAIAGRIDRAAGIAIRMIDAQNYYVVRANALEDNVNFYRVINGSRHEIAGGSAKVSSDTWHTLRLKAEGDSFAIGLNGRTLFSARDKTFSKAGKIALWTKADSVTWFDALTIQPLP